MTEDGARAGILGRIRRGLGVTGNEPARLSAVAGRLGAHGRNLVPDRSRGDAAHREALFESMATAVHATVARVPSREEVPAAISDYLRNLNLPQRLRHGADPLLASLPWRTTAIEVSTGRADPSDEVSLSHAFAGVAETGTLAMVSGPDNPTTLNFLPETHVVVLEAKDLVGAYEDVWDRLRSRFGEGVMPRVVNMITGPSRTADIEQKIELGAHGPRRLHIILLEESA
ncbi:MAG: lactate utilization protein C [Parvibaculaceae bacterium]